MLKRNKSFLPFIITIIILLLSCSRQKKSFQRISENNTGINFENKLPEKENLNILYYLYYYEGGGVAAGDINNDKLPDLYFSSNTKGNNKLYLNKGNFQFEDITQKAGVAGTADWSSGVSMADVNADGWLDIYVCVVAKKSGLTGKNQLFINNKNGTFTEKAADYGLDLEAYSCQAGFFDYDHDGDLDCYLLNQSDRPFERLVDTSFRRVYDSLSGDRLLRNDLNISGKFTDVSKQAGIFQSNLGYGLGLAIADINQDGWDDIYIGNDFHENDYYYINNKNGTFTESGAKHFGHYSRFSMGNDIADFNNDGHPDIVTADMLPDDEKILKTYGSDENANIYQFKITKNGFQHQYSKNCLQLNNGNGSSFSEIGLMSGMPATDWSWATFFADLDNDGNKDLFFSSGVVKRTTDMDYVKFISDAYVRRQMDRSAVLDKEAIEKMPDGISHNYIFKGDGHAFFKDVSKEWGLLNDKGYFTGAAYADLDNDGDLDIVVNAINSKARVYKNNLPTKNFIVLEPKGNNHNTFGTGVKAWLFSKGKMQYLQSAPVRGFLSSMDNRLFFGLDTFSAADSILIVWPSQKFQVIKNVKANQFLTVKETDATGAFDYQSYFPPQPSMFEPVNPGEINWAHKENIIFDFNIQYLIPQAKSTLGPRIAVADINKDGLDDFYVCGAAGQTGALYVQRKEGSFTSVQQTLFAGQEAAEETNALFFDANKDQFPDLYIVAGGNQLQDNNPLLADRLYMNDGKGNFSLAGNNLPQIFQNKSCAAAGDVDSDGDQDLFVGVHANSLAYGLPQTSYLLLNDGSGKFSMADSSYINLINIGLVTSAAFADANNDSLPDLVVVGEWMPVTWYINKGKGFEKKVIKNSTGLWQTVFADDVNNDGNTDLLLGNWGWNTKFHYQKDGPLRLYVKDFDKNGKVDQLISYVWKGKEYPFLAKDEVERQLPLLKKHYLKYSEYAGVQFKDVYYGWVEDVVPYQAEKLGSAIAAGNGNGDFSIIEFPAPLQMAPVFAFQKINSNQDYNTYILGGNFFDVSPYEGRYDAQPLATFTVSKNNTINKFTDPRLSSYQGQVRDIKWINSTGKPIIAIGANNKSLEFLKIK